MFLCYTQAKMECGKEQGSHQESNPARWFEPATTTHDHQSPIFHPSNVQVVLLCCNLTPNSPQN